MLKSTQMAMNIEKRKKELAQLLKIDEKKRRIFEIQQEMARPDFWQDQKRAEERSRELSDLTKIANALENVDNEKDLAKLELQSLFTGPYDQHGVYLSIYAGAGGTEAQDWANMLMRMYKRWAEKQGFKYEVLDISAGEETGIKSATLKIMGLNAFGWLKSESGVHRLVRLSPFDADHARHTSFALVEILPELKEIKGIEIKPQEIRIDVFRSGGHGGQGVNTTDSAVRITHLPTGTMVTCQNQRSQIQNRETATKILQARLYRLKLQQEEKKRQALRGDLISPEWGSQIRSYVLHPYKMIKDHRTGFESSDPDSVLDGELDGLMEAYLKGNKPH